MQLTKKEIDEALNERHSQEVQQKLPIMDLLKTLLLWAESQVVHLVAVQRQLQRKCVISL